MEHWEKLMAVQRMQDFIEDHIKEPICLYDLGRASGYSPWYAARVFKEMTGKAPFHYVRSLRLTRAAKELQNPSGSIVDVALDFVFDSHEGFTRAFSKQFGLTPKEYRKTRPPIQLFFPMRMLDFYRKLQQGEIEMPENETMNTVFVQVIERPARKLILKRGKNAADYFAYCEEVGCGIWDILTGIKDALYEPIGMWLPENLRREGTSEYAQGVEMPADYTGSVPEGFEIISLPACKMMVFQGPPYDDSDFENAIAAIWGVMKRYNPELYGFKWADSDGPRFQLAPMGYRGYIEARPVRPING